MGKQRVEGVSVGMNYKADYENAGSGEDWDQLPGETAKAYSAFCVYRDMGPDKRSAQKCADMLGKSIGTVGRWASEWKWYARARAYDAYLEKQKRDQNEQAIMDMNKRHIQISMQAQNIGIKHLGVLAKHMVKRDPVTGKPDPSLELGLDELVLDPVTAIRFITEGIKLERLARGEATEIHGKPEGELSIREEHSISDGFAHSRIATEMTARLRNASKEERDRILQQYLEAVDNINEMIGVPEEERAEGVIGPKPLTSQQKEEIALNEAVLEREREIRGQSS